MKRTFFKTSFLAFTGIIAALLCCVPVANASLTIAPTIVIMKGRERYADISLINPDKSTETYDVDWVFMSMEEGTGSYKDSAGSITDFDLTKHLVVTPRRVTLPPDGVQKIRLGLRLNGEPPAPGDYRAHIKFGSKNATNDGKPLPKSNDSKEPKTSVGVMINVGFSIPVIYRVGESTDKVEFGKITTDVNPKNKRIEVHIPTTKTKSMFGAMGAITIYYQDKIVGQIKNANIFPEITSRTFTVPLNVDKMSGGSLHVVYKDFDKEKDITLAETTIPVGQ